MTEQATVLNRPAPAGASARPDGPPKLHVVPPPADDLQSETATDDSTPAETVSAGQNLAGPATSTPGRVQIAGLKAFWDASRNYWTPPAIFTDRPASLQDLADYAKHAPWTHQHTGLLRNLGVGYYRFVAYPRTVCLRYSEWVWQRPARLALHLGGLKLLALTGPGHWLTHTVIYPVAQYAGHIFL